jgi:hypothetical protein
MCLLRCGNRRDPLGEGKKFGGVCLQSIVGEERAEGHLLGMNGLPGLVQNALRGMNTFGRRCNQQARLFERLPNGRHLRGRILRCVVVSAWEDLQRLVSGPNVED